MRIQHLLVAVAVVAATILPARALDLIEIADGLVDVKHLSRVNNQLFYYADDALYRIEPIYAGDTLDDFNIFTVTTSAAGIAAWGLTDATTVTTTTSFYFATHQEWNGQGALWISDGTVGGTVAVTENVPRLTGVAHVGGGEVFFANDPSGNDPAIAVSTLWKTDGTLVEMVRDDIPGQVRGLTAVGGAGHAFFTTYDGTDYRLWASDGTAGGTVDITPPGGFPEDISYWYLTDVGGTLHFPVGNEGSFFPVFEPQTDFAIWRSDGTVEGTVPITATAGLEIPINFRVQDGPHLWFSTFSNRDDEYDSEVFRLDTLTDTLDLIKGGLDTVYSSDLAVADDGSGIVYFAEYNEDLDISTIWRTDGTPAGTYVFLDELTEVHDLTCIGGVLYYASYPFEFGFAFAPQAASAPSASADPPLPGTWVGSLLALDQDGVETVAVTLGSALPVTPGELGQEPVTQFTKKPSVWSLFRDRNRNPDAKAKKASWKIANTISAKAPTDVAYAEWTKKFVLYDKKAVKGMPAEALPSLSPARINGVEVLAKEFGPVATSLPKVFLLSPPTIDAIRTGADEELLAPPQEGDVLLVVGMHFGAKPPKLYVEHDPKGDGKLKRKACKAVSAKVTPLPFMNAAGKRNASCMMVRMDDPDLEPMLLGYSKMRYAYPKGVVNPTDWFILDNGIGLATWLLKK